MQVPILNGIKTDESSDFRSAYPRNLIPVPKPTGISNGYLLPADGITAFAPATPGINRGGVNWNSVCYRVCGSSLCSIAADGTATVLGDVTGSLDAEQVTIDYSFDYLAVASMRNMYLWDGSTLQQITDPDLGVVLDFIWVDGYFMTTDGVNLVVTELNDPFSVNPLKYGSAESDPDPVLALLKVRNEPHALGRYTIEAFDNVGGTGFPFQRIDGAQIQRGTIGTHCCCVYLENIAFLGSGRNEPPAVWLGANGQSVKISSREIDIILQTYTEDVLAKVVMEPRVDKGHQQLYLHLPDQSWLYDHAASEIAKESVWSQLTTSIHGSAQYKVRNMVWCYDKWLVGHTTQALTGFFTSATSDHWGVENGWDFSTVIVYNDSAGAIFHEIELVALTGRTVAGKDPTISTSYSVDGETWSQDRFIRSGKNGNRKKRLVWLQQGPMRNFRIQRFRGTSNSHLTFARLEIQLEGLTV